ncbi:uncharacterized protein LOC134766537 [Penaeus indicus]|uniref:uncharacterized protein LOC134766537 n=1 Tax=Penaeus indicus TaxID=29960 RepID=UPI00300D2291
MWVASLTVMMTSVVVMVTSRAEKAPAAPQCEVDATQGAIEKETGAYVNNSRLHLWFKADTAAEVTLVIKHGQEKSEEKFNVNGDKIGTWHRLIVQYHKEYGLEWTALEKKNQYVDKNRYKKDWQVALKSNTIVIWSTCDMRVISSQPDTTQRTQTTPAPCQNDEQTNSLPSSSSSHGSDPIQEECGGNQDLYLLYAVYGMAILCALLVLLSLVLCVRIFSVMRSKASVEGLATATYSAPRKPIDDDAIYEEVNDNIIMRSASVEAQDQNHTSERPQSEHNSENSLYGSVSR